MSGEMDALDRAQPCVRATTMSDEESDEYVMSGDCRLASCTQGIHEEVEAERRRRSSTLVLVRSRSGSRCRTRKKSRDSSCSSLGNDYLQKLLCISQCRSAALAPALLVRRQRQDTFQLPHHEPNSPLNTIACVWHAFLRSTKTKNNSEQLGIAVPWPRPWSAA